MDGGSGHEFTLPHPSASDMLAMEKNQTVFFRLESLTQSPNTAVACAAKGGFEASCKNCPPGLAVGFGVCVCVCDVTFCPPRAAR
eukprot:6471313-Amphidinium_carterae.1